jgi:hypothetical protein
VEDFEGEDGEAVDHEAGAFGVEFGCGVWEAGGAECVGESNVTLLSEVVAALIHFIDGAFDFGDVVIGSVGGAGAVFGVPEIEVGAVLGEDDGENGVAWDGLKVFLMPPRGERVVEIGNFDGGEVERRGHCGS